MLSADSGPDRPASPRRAIGEKGLMPVDLATVGSMASSLDQWFPTWWTVLIADARHLSRD
ncbi:MAG: hypothetical protein ACLP4R_27330 [Solirubrobacteraceae bacterium]